MNTGHKSESVCPERVSATKKDELCRHNQFRGPAQADSCHQYPTEVGY
jgi:hypothetical protein